jgi:hypothetical protein
MLHRARDTRAVFLGNGPSRHMSRFVVHFVAPLA